GGGEVVVGEAGVVVVDHAAVEVLAACAADAAVTIDGEVADGNIGVADDDRVVAGGIEDHATADEVSVSQGRHDRHICAGRAAAGHDDPLVHGDVGFLV